MTDVGRKREVNQDYVYVTDQPVGPFPNFLAVADGMGGHKVVDFCVKIYGKYGIGRIGEDTA